MSGWEGRRRTSDPGEREPVGAPNGVTSPTIRRYATPLGRALHERGDREQPPTIHDAATAAVEHKDAGAAVDGEVALRVGSHLGVDFSGVRVHQDPLAQEATAAMGARAFAYGGDVFLGPGESGDDLALMAHELTHVAQQGAAGQRAPQRQVQVGDANSPAEHQADAVAGAVTSGAAPPASLLVDDGPVGPGQMSKAAFLEQLRAQVTAAADEELGPIYSAIGCPYIDRYFRSYAGQPATAAEALIKRYAPAARTARTAADMIPAVVARVRVGVRAWRDTGQPPPEIASLDPAAAAAAPAAASPAQAQAMRAPDGRETLASLEADLGPGQTLDGGTARRMSDALGADVSGARIHTGAVAARKADDAGAMAFAVGDHVVLGARAPAAGTIEGDALLAHELAHVAQQSGAARDPVARMQPIGGESSHAEDDADRAAAGAIATLHGDRLPAERSRIARAARSVGDFLTTGLRLQRCPNNNQAQTTAATPTPDEQAAMTFNGGLGYDGASINAIQTQVGAAVTGSFDLQTVQHIATWQSGRGLGGRGKVDADTLKALVMAMVAASRQDGAIHLIVNAYNLPTANLARIYYDPGTTSADAVTSGTIGTGQPQTVAVGPSTFTGSYEHAVKIIGHELQHVQQRTGAVPITNADAREFLSYAWEALDTTTPALTPQERVLHANLAIQRYNRLSAGEQASYRPTFLKLQTLIAAGGVGNP